jgi:hypothetical protein
MTIALEIRETMRLLTPLGARDSSVLATIMDEEAGESNTTCSPPGPPASAPSLSRSTNNLNNNGQNERDDFGYRGNSKGPQQKLHRRHRSVPVFSAPIDRAKQALNRRSVGEADTQHSHLTGIGGSNGEEENQQDPERSSGPMDRRRAAMGPRPPAHPVNNIGGEHSDDQRTQAFQSIFGRPLAAHRDAQAHVQQRPPPPGPASHYYSQQHPQQAPPLRHLQPLAHPQQPYQRSIRGQEQSHGYPYNYPQSNRSLSAIASTGIIASAPPPPQDPSLDFFTNQGLTPAQAYQAQVFAQKQPYGGPPPGAYLSEQGDSHNDPLSLPPRLDGLTLSDDGGRLSLDFNHQSPPRSNGSTARVPHQPVAKFDDEPDSELPWASAGQRTRENFRN